MKLIVGLGNPGARYARTRHNVGFDAVDTLASRLGWAWDTRRGSSTLAIGIVRAAAPLASLPRQSGVYAGPAGPSAPVEAPAQPAQPAPVGRDEKVLLAKPQTFMNDSGVAVSDLIRFYKLPLADLLVICDDLDLPLARVRLRARGAAGGQHGLESIIRLIGSSDFSRLKIGVGRPAHGRGENVDFLLSAPRGDERIALDAAIDRAADAALCWVTEGVAAAMNRFNA